MTNPIYNHIEVEKIILELSEARAKGEYVTPYLRQLQESVVEVIEENDTGTDDAVNQAVESLWAKILDLILKVPRSIFVEPKILSHFPNFLSKEYISLSYSVISIFISAIF